MTASATAPTREKAERASELRVGPEFFYLGSDAGTLSVRRGPAPSLTSKPAGI